jgi:hypothetical protein
VHCGSGFWAASVRVWHITSRGWDPWTERPLPEVVRVAYPRRPIPTSIVSAMCPPPGRAACRAVTPEPSGRRSPVSSRVASQFVWQRPEHCPWHGRSPVLDRDHCLASERW